MSTQNICNICGANYEYKAGRWICPACGAYKPDELSPEERTLIDTAERYLRTQHYVEAEEAFEDIIRKYPKSHEGYWGYVRARYGIKYEEDYDGKKIPTCATPSIESFTDDPDFLKAVALADRDTAEWYRSQAMYIERVRKIWIEKANKEEPYDIFICYKDSDRTVGVEQTNDSIEAAMLWAHLQAKGYRVFFSRESLRDKVGEKYEPYIFNALSTAKVMIVYGSSAEYINATWLKNEWHRYIKKIEKGEKKENSLIVAYDGFSPNELPSLLSSKQCLDASKNNRNFYHDLDACVDKIVTGYSKTAQPIAKPKSIPIVSALHEHKYEQEVIQGNCISKGYTIHRCACGEEYRDSFTPLQEHTFKKTKTQEPTCTETGYEEYTCSVCGDKDKRPIAAKGHSFGGWIEKKRPTCTEKGEQVRQCSICGEVDSELIAATGHKWSKPVERKDKNGNPISVCICSQCGEENIEFSKDFKRRKKIKILLHSVITLFLSGITGLSIFTWYNYETSFHLCILMGTFSIVYPFIAAFISLIRYQEKKKKFIAVCLCLFATFVIGLNIYLYYINPFQYKLLNDNTYEISYVRNKAITEINIPEYYNGRKITSIGARAFIFCHDLTTITMSNSITNIGDYAMNNCRSLKDIKISNSIVHIGKYSFAFCYDLENIEFPQTLIYIDEYAFKRGSNLTSVSIPNSVTSIGVGVFSECPGLTIYCEPMGKPSGWNENWNSSNRPVIWGNESCNEFKAINVGDTYSFGFYEQDNNINNGQEAIEWLVLAKEGGRILVISKYALDAKSPRTSTRNWENSSIREWLNDSFIDNAFSENEKAMIPTVTVSADKNPQYDSNQGNDTKDRIFLLSITEAIKYISVNERICEPTAYAIANNSGVWNGKCVWWLRSNGFSEAYATTVYTDGGINYTGELTFYENISVRPAMWIDFAS